MRYLGLCFLFCNLLINTAWAAPQKLYTWTFKNNLSVIFLADHRAPVVISEIWYKVGSSDEPNGETGISHTLEHMMFKGTHRFPEGQFNQLITKNGGQFNAATNFDFTHYYEILSADKLELALQLESDRMQYLNLTDEAFTKELQVVLEERRMRTDDNPVMLAYERFLAAANISNPYHHMPIGWPSDIAHLTKTDLQNWYNSWYAPNNAVLVIVGDEDPEQVKSLCEKYFAQIPSKTLPISKPHPPQTSLGKQEITVNLPAHVPTVILGYNVPSILSDNASTDPYVLDMLAAILDGGDSALIPTEIIRNKAIATDANISYSPYSRFSQQFIFTGTPTQNHTSEELIAAFKHEIEILQTQPLSQEVLTRVINQMTAEKIYARDEISVQADELGLMVSLGLPPDEWDHYLKEIKKITPEKIQAIAKKYFTDDRLTVTTLIPKTPQSPKTIARSAS
jgi:zinc protease